MKIVAFKDGLGNQLFQYRLYSHLKNRYPNEKIYGYYNKKWLKAHNGLEIFDRFDIEKPSSNLFIDFITIILRALDKFIPLVAKDSSFHDNSMLYVGYWQDKSFWDSDFSPIPFRTIDLSDDNVKILNMIKETQSVFVHIRRGDYLNPENSIYNVCTIDYYNKAIQVINAKVSSPRYFIFSDDIEWAKENLIIPNACYIDFNKGSDSFIDMYLMSQCKYGIIANSTFSYWGAINGIAKSIIIFPSKWKIKATGNMPNIFKPNWLQL